MIERMRHIFQKVSDFFIICLNNYALPPEYIVFRNMNEQSK